MAKLKKRIAKIGLPPAINAPQAVKQKGINKIQKTKRNTNLKNIGKGAIGTATSYGIWDLITNVLNALPAGKHGGRVTRRGIGKAKRGFGRVMGKN